MDSDKWVAYYAEDGEVETFQSEFAAKAWLTEKHEYDAKNGDGYSILSTEGQDFIARITYRSKFVVTDKKENHCQKAESDDSCFGCAHENKCNMEPWPYGSDIEEVGNLTIEPVTEHKTALCEGTDHLKPEPEPVQTKCPPHQWANAAGNLVCLKCGVIDAD